MVDTGVQPLAIGISIAAPCAAFVFVLMRLYSRYYITRNLGWDDALIILAMVLAISEAYTAVMGLGGYMADIQAVNVSGIKTFYLGYHFKDIPTGAVDELLGDKYNYATQLLYNPILALVKYSMLLFFYRIGSTIDSLRWFIIGIIIFNSMMGAAIFLTDMLQCIPFEKTFLPQSEGTCINIGNFFIATASLTILTDIMVLIIPTWITWNLQLKLRKKLAVIFLLSLGIIVTGMSIYRLCYLVLVYYGPPISDPTYGIQGTASSVEVNLAIIAACGPFLKPIVVRFCPGFFGRDMSNQYYYYSYTRAGEGGSQSTRPIDYYGNTYSASATAVSIPQSKRSSHLRGIGGGLVSVHEDLELQCPRKSLRRGMSVKALTQMEEEEDDHSSQRAMVPGASRGQGTTSPPGDEVKEAKEGIIMETHFEITYSPRESADELHVQQLDAPAPGTAI